MSNEIVVQNDSQLSQALTANEIRAQVNRIQEVMKAVMQCGIHYGKIPGCGDKPTLLKPGAEKILATFQIAVEPKIESEIRTANEYTVRVKAVATSASGRYLGAAVGEASSNEEKYKWRRAICDKEYDITPEDQRRIAFKRYEGKITEIKQVKTNIADIANTVLKIAVKRAEVAVCLQVTAASDCFTQDIEDLPEEVAREVVDQKPEIKTPQPKSAKPATQDDTVFISPEQRARLFAIARKANVDEETLRDHLRSLYKIESTNDIRKAWYDAICKWTENGGQNIVTQ